MKRKGIETLTPEEVPYENKIINIILAEDSMIGLVKVYWMRAYIPTKKPKRSTSGVAIELVPGVLDTPDVEYGGAEYNKLMGEITGKFGFEIQTIVGNELAYNLDPTLDIDPEVRYFMENADIRFAGLKNVGSLTHSITDNNLPIVIHTMDDDTTEDYSVIREAAIFSFNMVAKARVNEILDDYEGDRKEHEEEPLRGIPACSLANDPAIREGIELAKESKKLETTSRRERRENRRALDKKVKNSKIFKDIKPTLFS